MAAADGPPAQHLTHLTRAGEGARRHGLFEVLRGAEARALRLPRIGRARRPNQSIADLAQAPALGFPAPTLESVTVERGRGLVTGHWLGLLGPMGPLPTHLTEFAHYERRYARTRPFGRFLDLLANRMLQLFYRAWGDSQPVVHADRPDDDRFVRYLSALSGATEGARAASAFPAAARVHYAALFASRRSAVAIEDALSDLLGQRVRVTEYSPRWRDIDGEDQTRLGSRFAVLGGDAMAGRRVKSASDAFRVTVHAATLAEAEALLPSGRTFRILAEAIDAFAPGHLEWDLVVELPEAEARAARLDGRSRLGWTGWLAPDAAAGGSRGDIRLRRTAIRSARRYSGGRGS